jgi:hypothetical protein
MKYLFLLVLLVGCAEQASSSEAMDRAREACAPNGGIRTFVRIAGTPDDFRAYCMNGLRIEGNAKEYE